MLDHLAPLLTHYAKRINTSLAAHSKGMQLTIAIMPCPTKVSDETLRQKLIQPIVVVGDAQSIANQLEGLKDSLGEALGNEQLNASVNAFNAALNKAKTDSKAVTASKPPKTAIKAGTEGATVSTEDKNEVTAPKPIAQTALDDFLA